MVTRKPGSFRRHPKRKSGKTRTSHIKATDWLKSSQHVDTLTGTGEFATSFRASGNTSCHDDQNSSVIKYKKPWVAEKTTRDQAGRQGTGSCRNGNSEIDEFLIWTKASGKSAASIACNKGQSHSAIKKDSSKRKTITPNNQTWISRPNKDVLQTQKRPLMTTNDQFESRLA